MYIYRYIHIRIYIQTYTCLHIYTHTSTYVRRMTRSLLQRAQHIVLIYRSLLMDAGFIHRSFLMYIFSYESLLRASPTQKIYLSLSSEARFFFVGFFLGVFCFGGLFFTRDSITMSDCLCVCVCVCVCVSQSAQRETTYGVALVSRIDKITRLLSKRAL